MNLTIISSTGAPNPALIVVIVVLGLYLLLKLTPLGARLFGNQAGSQDSAPAQAPEIAPQAAAPREESLPADDCELVAVITAALMAYAPSGKTLVVRNIRRASAWARAGRDEQIANRL